MIGFFSDENFNNDILRGLAVREPSIEVIRIQDTDIFGAADPVILEWASKEKLFVLTHDRSTMPDLFYERLAAGLPVTSVVVVPSRMPVRVAVEQLLMLCLCSEAEEWIGMVVHLPL